MGAFLELPELPLIAILRGLSPERAVETGRVLIEEGFGVIEVPLNRPGALDCIAALAAAYGGSALIGAGTVLTVEQVRGVRSAGGGLIVSPDTNPLVISAGRDEGLLCVPGAATPTEAFTALRAGAHGVKVFPAETIGPAGIKAWRAVLPAEVPLIPVGGIMPESLAAYLAAGADGFGIGSPLFTPEREDDETRKRARAFREAYREASGRRA